MNHTHHLLVTHIYTNISTRAQPQALSNGSAYQGEGPNYLSHKYTHKVPFKGPWVLQLPYDYTHFLHTQHLSYTYSTSRAKTAIRLDFCSKVAMCCFQLVWKERAFCGQREQEREREGEQSEHLADQQILVILSEREAYPAIFWGGEIKFKRNQ